MEQRHSPLSFLSRRYKGTQLDWSFLQKGSFEVLYTLERLYWLVIHPEGFKHFKDHNNLIFLFDPKSIVPDMSQTTLRRLLRWDMTLSMYNYKFYRINSEKKTSGQIS